MNEIGKEENLAQQHWTFMEGLLVTLGDDDRYGIETLEYLYIKAFIHGYKHGLQNQRGNDD